jgi:hypothetical protein
MFARVPSMADFCQNLQKKYCMNDRSFTEIEYLQTVEDMLFNCRDVQQLRVNLPFQLVGRYCNAATMILANTFKAFSRRPEEDSSKLTALVLENVADIAMCNLWTNPSDVMNIMVVLDILEHLILTVRRHETEPQRVELFSTCLWDIIRNAENLKSLCLVGLDHDDRPPRGLKRTKPWTMDADEWRARSLPSPQFLLPCLTCLELRRVEVSPDVFRGAANSFSSTLRELYLNEVYLKAEQGRDLNSDSKQILWIGIPNCRPSENDSWIAMMVRESMPALKICRASFLGYDHYLREDGVSGAEIEPEFDFIDPCGLGRSLAQRFVEVVTGIAQHHTPNGEPVEYLPPNSANDWLLSNLRPRPRPLRVVEYDTNAYQTAVANTTSVWQKSIDGLFPNCNNNTLDELHYIAETACQGMNEIHNRRNEWSTRNSVASEFTENLFNYPVVEE